MPAPTVSNTSSNSTIQDKKKLKDNPLLDQEDQTTNEIVEFLQKHGFNPDVSLEDAQGFKPSLFDAIKRRYRKLQREGRI